MPYTRQQRKLFNAARADPEIAREHGMTHGTASDLASEANRLKRQGREKREKASGDNAMPFVDLTQIFRPYRS